MARDVTGRLYLTGDLVARTPLHVGGFGDDVDTDLPLARDGAGRWYVPGTSLAGALRGWCEQAFGNGATGEKSPVSRVWGYQEGEEGYASFAYVEDAALPDGVTVVTEVRDGVGIDRKWGCAAEHIKYDRAILPRGTRLKLHLAVDVKGENRSLALAMLAGLADALAAEEVRLGAAKTRGLGRLRLERHALHEEQFCTRAGILAVLRGRRAGAPGQPIVNADLCAARAAHRPKPRPRLTVEVAWEPVGPLMVKAGYEGVAVDMLPLLSGIDGALAPVLPGSAVKGALRGQAERIVCTLLGVEPTGETNPRKRFLENTDVPLVEALFGARNKPVRKSPKEETERRRGRNFRGYGKHYLARLGRGALGVDDCYASELRIDPAMWEAVARATEVKSNQRIVKSAEEALRENLNAASLQHWQQGFHVAIDRWTGGAAESFLYSVLEPHEGRWEPLRLTVDLDRLVEDERLPAVTLLALVMRDLAAGRLPLGFAVNRGMGAVRVSAVTATFADVKFVPHGWLVGGDGSATIPLLDPPAEFRQALNEAWREWLDRPRAEVTS